MKIETIKIKNFRGLDIECNGLDDKTLIIGQNDCGKSNICAAILKVFSFEKRRIPFFSSDSSFNNNQEISLFFKLDLSEISTEHLGLIQDYIYYEDDIIKMDVWMNSTFNEEIMQYEDELFFGEKDSDENTIPINRQNKLDKILSIVYINPAYDLTAEKKNYFGYKEVKKIENQLSLGVNIKDTIVELQDAVKEEDAFKDVIEDINNLGEFGLLFDGMKFELCPNIKVDSIFNSLDIMNYNSEGKQIDHIGDGKSKILSMILKAKTIDNDKNKIFIVEEPENHLYVLLQKYYLSAILSLAPEQLIITTHSPFIVDFEKLNHIVKISKLLDENGVLFTKTYSFNINNNDFKKFGYLINTEISEMIYYDIVVLLEGYSEKYFYNLLSIKDANFYRYLTSNRIGLYSIGNIAFKNTKELLESLGVKVYIKTDNDLTKVKNSQKYRYTGLKRVYDYLKDEDKNKFLKILSIEKESELLNSLTTEETENEIESIEQKMTEFAALCKENNILLSEHHDGFEKDFLDYINISKSSYDETFNFLKSAKLKNLHEYIEENDINININDQNIDSILLGFVNKDEILR